MEVIRMISEDFDKFMEYDPSYKLYLRCKKLFAKHPKRRCIEMLLDQMEFYDDTRILCCIAEGVVTHFKYQEGIDINYGIEYNGKKVYFYRRDSDMKYKFSIEIPYATRSKYFEFVKCVNECVEAEGYIALYVNNIPYSLQSYLVVETEFGGKKIEELLLEHGLKNDTSRGFDEFWQEISKRQWNFFTLSSSENAVRLAFGLYEYAEIEELEQKGYHFEQMKRKKIFISYCHKDKEIVRNAVDLMQKEGLYVWIDHQEIDAGDSILERVLSGFRESDFAIIFVSNKTLEAQFAKFELTSIWREVIYKKINFFIIRLDGVDMDTVYSGLGQYSYYDLSENPSLEDLVKAIRRKLERIKDND